MGRKKEATRSKQVRKFAKVRNLCENVMSLHLHLDMDTKTRDTNRNRRRHTIGLEFSQGTKMDQFRDLKKKQNTNRLQIIMKK